MSDKIATVTIREGRRKLHFFGHPKDHIFKTMIKTNKVYENDMLQYIKTLGTKGVYIDVGANIGTHTIFFASLSKSTKVYAYEPSRKILKYLEKTVASNTKRIRKKVVVKPLAVGDKAGAVSVLDAPEDNLGQTKVVAGGDVPVVTLDKEHMDERVALIQIDVEGYEEQVLKGAKRLLAKQKPHVFIEAWDEKAREKLERHLLPLGYKKIRKFNATPTYHYQAK